MNLSRRQFLVTAAGAVAATVGAVAITAAASPPIAPGRGNGYAPIRKVTGAPPLPHQAPLSSMGDMPMQRPDGKWLSHLLPFAGPFPDRASLEAQVARGRALGLYP